MTRLAALLAPALGLLALMAPSSAHAQSRAELREARELFHAGLEAARDGRWPQARDAFERSLAITERASTVLNLAGALAETGALLESVQAYERFLEIAEGRDARRRPAAEEALARVRERVPTLELDTSALEPDDQLEIDGEALEREAAAAAIPLDPGAHHVAVRRADDVVFERHISLAEGSREGVVLTPRAVVPTPQEVAVAADVTEPEDGGDDDTAIAVGIGVGAGVAVLAAVAIVLAVVLSGESMPYVGNLGDGVIPL